ncbi:MULTISPECIES: C40 family peptidase [Anoxybacillus]|uniref:Gamma-DL-glutamyl hydrolase n=1 Tax=Anoxybacillus ayderensis TaxID=265546 RepID=A0A0D0HNG2_9BACL|nr:MULTISPECIES: C40 family peptidase [Anoxybacillus]EPZ39521.1 cell wall-associated hydrolase (NlpC/P60 family) [Anoxybacillus ayderensis]KHF29487.1 Gamma-DL-glutamyl hydrolase precursor [Anoxybacillus sp. BCO1]KIP20772.1 Gamma-DL-glutamyl hydrolase precursor [Anoxybacillus ayderensis]NNU97140.1 NlpC/P60 family protein [Anoxybacillus sp. EFIL]
MKKSLATAALFMILCFTFFANPFKTEAAFSANTLIAEAQKVIGTPYRAGGTTPKGFDCSGFVSYTYKKLGVSLPRSSEAMYGVGKPVSLNQLAPGDLLFFKTSKHKGISHVAIYIGHGRMVHSTSSKGVKIDSIHQSYWKQRFVGAKRL